MKSPTFDFDCPHCGQPLSGNQQHLGKSLKCPKCNASFTVPAPLPVPPRVAQGGRKHRSRQDPLKVLLIYGAALIIIAICAGVFYFRHSHNTIRGTSEKPSPLPETLKTALATPTPAPASEVTPRVAAPNKTPEVKPPTATPINRVSDQAIEEGRNIAARILEKYPKLKVSVLSGNIHPKPDGFEVHGSGTLYPTTGFILPLAEWNNLTKTQQISLTIYVESRIAFIRGHPDDYTTSRSTGSFHQRELWAIRQISNDAWFIGTTTTFPDDSQGNLYLDRMLVQGDGAWTHSDSHSGIKASEFRK